MSQNTQLIKETIIKSTNFKNIQQFEENVRKLRSMSDDSYGFRKEYANMLEHIVEFAVLCNKEYGTKNDKMDVDPMLDDLIIFFMQTLMKAGYRVDEKAVLA